MCAKFATRNNTAARETKTPRLWKRGRDGLFVYCALALGSNTQPIGYNGDGGGADLRIA
jgi:hypothetical protein